MAKAAVQYACTECSYAAGRWFGKCPGCNAFGSLVEETPASAVPPAKPLLRLVDVDAEEATRISTGVPELGLGGGLVRAVLVGEPGVGKSTLLLSALGAVARDGRRALLVTGEESTAQVKLRAARLGGTEQVEILAETELDAVCATLERERPDVCVIDSIQTLYAADMGSAPGSVGQVRGRGRLLRVAKEHNVATILVGHVTKDGAVAGPRVLEHLVDCVLQFEGDRYHAHRVLRATPLRLDEQLGVFEMTGQGSSVCRTRPSSSARHSRARSAQRSPARWKGRPILLEIQALVAPTDLAMPRRVGTGVDEAARDDRRRPLRHAGVPLGAADVFVNVAGGLRIDEPGADLAIALAIASAAPRRAGAGGDRRVRRRSASPAACGRRRIGAAARGVRQARRPRRGRTGGNEESLADPGLRLGHVARRSACRARGPRRKPHQIGLNGQKVAVSRVSAILTRHAGELSSPPALSLNR